MMNAYEAGFAKAIQCLRNETMDDPENAEESTGEIDSLEEMREKCWEEWGQFGVTDYDPRENKELVKTSSKGRGRPAGSKSPPKPEEGPHLADLPHNPEKCRARFWNGGHGAQCWRDPLGGDDLCKGCAGRRDNSDKDFWGYYDEPLGSESEHKKAGGSHPWDILKKERVAKKDSAKKEKQTEKKKALREKAAKKKAEAAAKKEAAEAAKKEEEAAEAAKGAEEEGAEEEAAEGEGAEEEADGERIEIIQGENAAGEEIAVEIHHHSPRDDEDTQSLNDDVNDYKDEEPKEIFEEYECEGFKLKWNKETNVLLDPDDDEVMGKMIEKDGKWVPEISE